MIRPVKTWILFAVTLAATVQSTFAGGRNNGARLFGGNVSRPSFRAPIATPRVNAGRNLGQFQQPRVPTVMNGNPGGTFRNTMPVTTPHTGIQSGIVSGGQTPGAATRNLIGTTRPNLTLPGTIARPPAVGGNQRNTNPGGSNLSGLDPSRLADVRRQIGGGNAGLIADGAVPRRGNLTGVPTTGRREFAPGLGSGTGIGAGLTGNGQFGIDRPSRDDLPTPRLPGVGNNGTPPITGTVIGEELEPINGGGAGVPIDGTGTVVGEEIPPIHAEQPPANPPAEPPTNPPAESPADGQNGQDRVSDLISVVDAVSGLVGAVGSVNGSCPSSSGGGDAGFSGSTDGASSGYSSVEPQPVGAVEPGVPAIAEPIASADSKDLDIELTEVRLVDAGNLENKTGPRFRLTYRNKGSVEAPKFHVTVAVDIGRDLTETAEIVTVEAVGLKPGKSLSVDVRLPVEVLKMATDNSGKAAPFGLLAAILDSDESLDEINEENNVLVVARDEIKPIEKAGIVKK